MDSMLSTPAFILVEPQMGENIGAAARGMWNFGLSHMRIVNPRDGWPNPKAGAMASGAGRVLDGAMLAGTTEQAIGDLHYVYATTARPRELIKPVMTPEAAMADAAERIAAGQKVGVLFGRERTGLENDDIVRASAIISVPVNPEFPSLNLAQCVLLTAYEWRRQTDQTPGERLETNKTDIAEKIDVERMLAHLVEALDETGFFFPEHKRDSMLANLHNMFHRAPLTDQDIRTLRGVIRALSETRRTR